MEAARASQTPWDDCRIRSAHLTDRHRARRQEVRNSARSSAAANVLTGKLQVSPDSAEVGAGRSQATDQRATTQGMYHKHPPRGRNTAPRSAQSSPWPCHIALRAAPVICALFRRTVCAMSIGVPRRGYIGLRDTAARLFESRRGGTDLKVVARDLLVGFHDVCTFAGLDGVLAELAVVFAPLDVADRGALADHDAVFSALVARLRTLDLDPDSGGPRNAKPGQLADSVVAVLDLAVVETPDDSIALGDDVRVAVAAALASVVDVEMAAPTMRESIIADARARCDDSFHSAFDKIAAALDDRALHQVKQPKVPVHALHAVQRALTEARDAFVARVANAAIDRATAALERAGAPATDVAARIDRPITFRATVRDVAILRASDSGVPRMPSAQVRSLLDSLTTLARITWRAPEKPVKPYAASQTFAVGDVIDHPKFGRGSVVSCLAQRIDVEFADGKHTLIHVPPRR
jgi:hypothetical protein